MDWAVLMCVMASSVRPTSMRMPPEQVVGGGKPLGLIEGRQDSAHRTGSVTAHHAGRSQREPRLTQVRRTRDRPVRRLAGKPGHLARPLAPEERHAHAGARAPGEDRRIVRRAGQRLLVQLDGPDGVRPPELLVLVRRAKVEVDRHGVGRRDAGHGSSGDRQRLGDGAGHLVVDGEHVGRGALEALRPDSKAVGRADEARGHADARGRLAHRPLDDDLHAELRADLACVPLRAAQVRDRPARTDPEAAGHRQDVDEVLGHSVREIVVPRRASVLEGEHRDGPVGGGILGEAAAQGRRDREPDARRHERKARRGERNARRCDRGDRLLEGGGDLVRAAEAIVRGAAPCTA